MIDAAQSPEGWTPDPEWAVLWIGDRAEAGRLHTALPGCSMTVAEHPLEGVWLAGGAVYDAVLFSLTAGPVPDAALAGVRAVAPATRILVSCRPVDEPLARLALRGEADEYVIEPVRPHDFVEAARVRAPAGPQVAEPPIETAPPAADAGELPPFSEALAPPPPSVCEITALSELLRNLTDGVGPAIARMTTLIRDAFAARGASIRMDEHSHSIGDDDRGVLAQPIERDAAAVGEIRVFGVADDEASHARLAVYARLLSAVVEQARERENWCELAYTDEVTGLRNRRYLLRELRPMLEHARTRRLCVTVLLFDIDHFKQYNDDYGHDAGDQVLREVALLLNRCTREGDLVARYGGDEFAVVFRDDEQPRVPGSRHPSEPIELSGRLQQALGEHRFRCIGADAPGHVTISGGLASFPWNGADMEALLSAADSALLAAKRSGRNRIVLAAGPGAADPRPSAP